MESDGVGCTGTKRETGNLVWRRMNSINDGLRENVVSNEAEQARLVWSRK